MPDTNDQVNIKIVPEITEIDTTEATKSIKTSLKELNTAFTALFEKIGKLDASELNKSVGSALSKVVSAYKSATKEADLFNKKVAEAEESKAGVELLEQQLEKLQTEMSEFINSAKYSAKEYEAFLTTPAKFVSPSSSPYTNIPINTAVTGSIEAITGTRLESRIFRNPL